jgi:hypothetical protein
VIRRELHLLAIVGRLLEDVRQSGAKDLWQIQTVLCTRERGMELTYGV